MKGSCCLSSPLAISGPEGRKARAVHGSQFAETWWGPALLRAENTTSLIGLSPTSLGPLATGAVAAAWAGRKSALLQRRVQPHHGQPTAATRHRHESSLRHEDSLLKRRQEQEKICQPSFTGAARLVARFPCSAGTPWSGMHPRSAGISRQQGDEQQPPQQQERQGTLGRWKSSGFVKRWVTGLALGFGVCGPATFRGGWAFAILVSVAVTFVVQEYTMLLDNILVPQLEPSIRAFTLIISVGTVIAAKVGILTGIFECAAVGLLVMLLLLQGNKKATDGGPPIRFAHISSQVFGVFYCGYLPAFWVRLREIPVPLPSEPTPALRCLCSWLHWPLEPSVGAFAAASCALCIIAADTCAYLGGRRWGRRPLILISPRKTWEGLFCGLAGCVVMALLCDAAWGFPARPSLTVLGGALIFAASLLGDLTASAIKRDASVKDTGAVLPGHGGILDRFDSFFFSAPAAYLCWFVYLMAVGSPLAKFRGRA